MDTWDMVILEYNPNTRLSCFAKSFRPVVPHCVEYELLLRKALSVSPTPIVISLLMLLPETFR